jgi:pimeloyl-ACP methyl ester carboxylesterase
MGAGALLSLAVSEPGLLDRLVLVLPASVDRVGSGRTPSAARAIADAIDGEDLGALTTLLVEELPQPPDAAMLEWVHRRSRRLLGSSVGRGFRDLTLDVPVADRGALAAVDVPVLVIGAEGDPVHPPSVARELAEALPRGRPLVFPPGGLLWAHRAALREEISGFLSG